MLDYSRSSLILDESYVKEIFNKNSKKYFPDKDEIIDIRIEKTNPDWAKWDYNSRYTVHFSDDSIVKLRGVARADNSKRNAFIFTQYLWKHGFDQPPFLVYQSFDFFDDSGLFLYKEVPGTALVDILQEKKYPGILIERLADWLAKLHSLPAEKSNLPKAFFPKVKGYKGAFEKIKEYLPDVKMSLNFSINFLDKMWHDSGELIHNDFYPGNIIIDNKNIYCIDFVYSGLGPFMMDLATIYGCFEFPQFKNIFNKEQVEEFRSIFLQKYAKNRSLEYQEIIHALPKFLIKIFLDQIFYASYAFESWHDLSGETKNGVKNEIESCLMELNQINHGT